MERGKRLTMKIAFRFINASGVTVEDEISTQTLQEFSHKRNRGIETRKFHQIIS